MIQVYYGDGKGKTTASVGAAIRAAGSGMKILFIQFLKNGDSSECVVLKKLNNIDYKTSSKHYNLFDNFSLDKKESLMNAYKQLFDEMVSSSEQYQMIVMDEILDAIDFKLIDLNELLIFLSSHKDKLEIILTGHMCTKEIVNIADYVTETKSIKHPFEKGQAARLGIEF